MPQIYYETERIWANLAYGKLSMIYEGGQGTVSTDVNAAINEVIQASPLMGGRVRSLPRRFEGGPYRPAHALQCHRDDHPIQ